VEALLKEDMGGEAGLHYLIQYSREPRLVRRLESVRDQGG
jgi:hypothetical protein